MQLSRDIQRDDLDTLLFIFCSSPAMAVLPPFIRRLLGHDKQDQYSAWLLRHGRIIEGEIIDARRDESGVTIFYTYNISSVQYESSQPLRPEQLSGEQRYQPGMPVTVRFDPRNPGSSVVV
jgi:hypothetical protein